MAKHKHNVTVNLKCKDCKTNYDRCVEDIDARCVTYHGETQPDIPANQFDDLERIVENITKLIDSVKQELFNIEQDFENDKENINKVLSDKQLDAEGIDERIDDVNDRLTDLGNRFCQLIEKCPIIQQAIDRVNYILDNFCLITTGCLMGKGFPWKTDENKSGCSYSNTEYIPVYGEPTGRTYYVETQKITDSSHPHYGQERVVWIPKKDSECPGYVFKSYIIYMDGDEEKTLYFAPEDTPITNFESDYSDTSLTINGQDIVKNSIKKIYFGDSYNNVTSIGDWFLYRCSSLTSLDLSPLSNVTSIGDWFLSDCSGLTSVDLSGLSNITSIEANFLRECTSLTSVDLSPLSKVSSIGDSFLSRCSGLTSVDLSPLSNVTSIGWNFLRQMGTLSEVKMGAITPPTLGKNPFYQTTVQSILVPCESESAYKSATNWKSRASVISGWGCQ